MAKATRIHPDKIQSAKKALHALPMKYDGKTREEAVDILEKDIQKAMDKGHDIKKIAEILKNEGVSIPVSFLKKYLARGKKHTDTNYENSVGEDSQTINDKLKEKEVKKTMQVTPDTTEL